VMGYDLKSFYELQDKFEKLQCKHNRLRIDAEMDKGYKTWLFLFVSGGIIGFLIGLVV
jgi:hypothetical protein